MESVQVEPGPIQIPRYPIWFGCECVNFRPVERAATYDGIHPIEVDLAQVGQIVEQGYRAFQLRRSRPPLAINLATMSEELGPTVPYSMERARE
jgi:hypothetical protein